MLIHNILANDYKTISDIVQLQSEKTKRRMRFVEIITNTNLDNIQNSFQEILNFIKDNKDAPNCTIHYIYKLILSRFSIRPKNHDSYFTLLSLLTQIDSRPYIFKDCLPEFKEILVKWGIINKSEINEIKPKTILLREYGYWRRSREKTPDHCNTPEIDELLSYLYEDNLNMFIEQFHKLITPLTNNTDKKQYTTYFLNFNLPYDESIIPAYITLINHAAIFGSIKCYKFLLSNFYKNASPKHAIFGGNFEIIHLVENSNEFSFNNQAIFAFKFYRNDIAEYLLFHYKNEMIKNEDFLLIFNEEAYYYTLYVQYIHQNGHSDNNNITSFLNTINDDYQDACQIGMYDFVVETYKNYIEANKISKFNTLLVFYNSEKATAANREINNGIIEATINNNIELIQFFLSSEYSRIMKSEHSLINLALENCHKDLALLLYSNGFKSINAEAFSNLLILSRFDLLELALDMGFDIKKLYDTNIFAKLCLIGNFKCIKFLFDKGFDEKLVTFKNKANGLISAIQSQNYETVKILLDYGYDPQNAILEACLHAKNLDILKLLLDRGASIKNWKDTNDSSYLTSPICIACEIENREVMQFLLDNGANINEGYSVKYACIKENVEALKFLIEKGASVHKGKPLVTAIDKRNLEMVKLLVEHGADVNMSFGNEKHGIEEFSILNHAIYKKDEKIVEYLIDHGASLNNKEPLRFAMCSELNSMVILLIKKGANINSFPIIQRAISDKNFDIINFLIDNGADINNGPIIRDLIFNHEFQLAKKIIEKGVDLNNGSVLYAACRECNIEMVKLLLEKGLNPNDYKSLKIACKKNNLPIIKLLVDHGADIKNNNYLIKSLKGEYKKATLQVLQYLLQKGAVFINQKRDRFGNKKENAFEFAIQKDQLSVIKLFESFGLDLLNPENQYLLEYAILHNSKKCALYFIKKGMKLKEKISLINHSKLNKNETKFSSDLSLALIKNELVTENSLFCILKTAIESSYTEVIDLILSKNIFSNQRPKTMEPLFSNIFNFLLNTNPNPDYIKKFLDNGAPIIEPDDPLISSPLYVAMEKKLEDVAIQFIETLNDYNYTITFKRYQYPLIFYAAKFGLLQVTQYLLDHGVDINTEVITKNGVNTPMRFAIKSNLKTVIYFLDNGAKYDTYRVLMYSLKKEDLRIFELFVEKGITFDDELKHRVLYKILTDCSKSLARKMISQGANPNVFVYGLPLLYHFIKTKKMDKITFLLENGADPNLEFSANLNQNRNNNFVDAAFEFYPDCIQTLIDYGFDINKIIHCNYFSTTLIYYAIDSNNIKLFSAILEKGANIEYTFWNPLSSVLYYAIEKNKASYAIQLVKKGADYNKQFPNQETALTLAVKNSLTDLINLLLSLNASYNETLLIKYLPIIIKNRQNIILKKILMLDINIKETKILATACFSNTSTVIISLLDKGADPNYADGFAPPLIIAVYKNNDEITKILLERGADPNIVYEYNNNIKITPLDIAIYKNNVFSINILLQNNAKPLLANYKERQVLQSFTLNSPT